MSEPVLAEAIGTIDGVNKDFNTPSAYWVGTLFAYLNGVLIRKADENGPVEIGGTDVLIKIAPKTDDTLHFYYQTGPPVGGAILGPPDMLQAIELLPEIYAAIDLHPDIIDSQNQTPVDNTPQMIGNANLVPEIDSALDLRPEIIRAEEV
jgi:hypothetical protein